VTILLDRLEQAGKAGFGGWAFYLAGDIRAPPSKSNEFMIER
jgi:hypothetical protein